MADIDFPSGLPKALASAYTSTQAAAFIESEAASGGFYVRKITDDIFAEYNLQWALTDGQAVYLMAWFRAATQLGTKPFNMSMLIDGEEVTKECRFTQGGIPQLTSQQGKVYVYSARVFVRDNDNSFTDNYGMLQWFAERAPDGNPFTGMALLDQGITESAPEA